MILCDLDQVLATSRGLDTAYGSRIHRTFLHPPPQLALIKEAGIAFHIVTAKIEAEAWDVLWAIGLAPYVASVIGAQVLLWPSIFSALKNRRMPRSISKAFYGRYIANDQNERVVMIEDRRENLQAMFEAGCIDCGILTPPARVEGDHVVEWFDLDAVLRVAKGLALAKRHDAECMSQGLAMHRWRKDGVEAIDTSDVADVLGKDRYLVEIPTVTAATSHTPGISLQSLDTGQCLTPRRANMVAGLRMIRRMLRKRIEDL